jgi:hypothetical protein
MYKLRRPTTCILEEDGKKAVAITMPADTLVEPSGEIPAEGMVEVIWDNQRVSMFAIDLKERGEIVDSLKTTVLGYKTRGAKA